jgi:hypothetical protein
MHLNWIIVLFPVSSLDMLESSRSCVADCETLNMLAVIVWHTCFLVKCVQYFVGFNIILVLNVYICVLQELIMLSFSLELENNKVFYEKRVGRLNIHFTNKDITRSLQYKNMVSIVDWRHSAATGVRKGWNLHVYKKGPSIASKKGPSTMKINRG